MNIIDEILKFCVLIIGTMGYFAQVNNRFKFKKEDTVKSILKSIDSSIWCLIYIIFIVITFY